MSRHCVSLGAVAILVAAAGYASVVGQTVTGQEPRIGTWKLNLEKSQFAAGTAPQMQVRRLLSRRDGFVVFTQIGLDADGSPIFIQTTYKFDGKPYREYTQANLPEFAAVGTTPNMKPPPRIGGSPYWEPQRRTALP
jgi:hypothetical protein